VGAIALVLGAVVLLPMVLDSEPKRARQDIDIVIPPIPPQAVNDKPLPAPAPSPQTGAATAAPAAIEAPTPAPSSEPQGAQPAPEPRPATPAAAPSHASQGYVIQIGCFSDTAKARGLVAQIKNGGVAAFSARAPTGNCTRVRAGPFDSERSAQTARERLIKRNLIPPPSEGKIVQRGD